MSLNGILNTAVGGLLTNQTALRTTANNIANVNTPGYNRREVQFGPQLTAGTLTGVTIEDIRRISDQYLNQQSITATGASSQAEVLTKTIFVAGAHAGRRIIEDNGCYAVIVDDNAVVSEIGCLEEIAA